MTAPDAPRQSLRQLNHRDTHTLQSLLEADAAHARRVTGNARMTGPRSPCEPG